MSYALWIAAFNPGLRHDFLALASRRWNTCVSSATTSNSPCLKSLIPSGKPWRKTYFEFTNGSRMMAKSVGGGTGSAMLSCDDILWGTTGSELQRAADWFTVFCCLCYHSGRMMMVGTPFSYNDLYAQLEKTETFQVETYPAINKEGDAVAERWDLESLDQRRIPLPFSSSRIPVRADSRRGQHVPHGTA